VSSISASLLSSGIMVGTLVVGTSVVGAVGAVVPELLSKSSNLSSPGSYTLSLSLKLLIRVLAKE